MKRAIKLERVLITYDKHFLKTEINHYGIIIIDIHPPTNKKVLPILMDFLDTPKFEKMNLNNSVVVLRIDGYEII